MPQLGEGMTCRQIQSWESFDPHILYWWLYVACATSQPIVPSADDDYGSLHGYTENTTAIASSY